MADHEAQQGEVERTRRYVRTGRIDEREEDEENRSDEGLTYLPSAGLTHPAI